MISGVLAMSGGPLSASAVDPEPQNTYANLTTLIGCNIDEPLEAVRCLQSKPVEQIINTDSKFHVGFINFTLSANVCINFMLLLFFF